MSKPDWGTKRTCQNCGAKYYDLTRSPITCPKCGTVFNPDALLKSRRRPAKPAETPAPAKAVAAASKPAATEEEAPEVEKTDDIEDLSEGEDEEEVIEDASELGEDDMSDVVIGDDEKEES
ncbi:MAG: TIGR02300 family protein [Kiloniellales bacterium]|nr:TIGR02300 family protein [Kiloniellales bacterium]